MATASADFDNYKIFYYSSHTLDAYYDCLIYCYLGNTYVGRFEFYKEGTAETSLKSAIVGGKPFMRYRLSRFKDVLQILLHEKPLQIHVNDTNGIGTFYTTEGEPAGEEE